MVGFHTAQVVLQISFGCTESMDVDVVLSFCVFHVDVCQTQMSCEGVNILCKCSISLDPCLCIKYFIKSE